MNKTLDNLKKRKLFGLNDISFLLIVASLVLVVLFFLFNSQSNFKQVEVYLNGNLYGIYSLTEDKEVIIKQNEKINTIVINDGKVRIINATCDGQDCVTAGTVSSVRSIIVCMPHNILILIKGTDYDFAG